jgi:hypothetical protein
LADVIHNSTYKGTARYQSRNGVIEYSVTPLVDEWLWDAAQQATARNRRSRPRVPDEPISFAA